MILNTTTAQARPAHQYLTGSLSHFILHDNRDGADAPDMSAPAYLKTVVQGIQTIGTSVVIGTAEAPIAEGGPGPDRIRFAVENSGRTADDFMQAIHTSTGIPIQVAADTTATPPVTEVKGIKVTRMVY